MTKGKILFSLVSLVGALAFESSAFAGDLNASEVDGYLLMHAQTAVVFETREAMRKYDYAHCKVVGSSAKFFRKLQRLNKHFVRIRAESLGDTETSFPSTREPHFNKVRGRRIEQWCDDKTVYWAESVSK
jgi:hypothetical protein